MSKKPKIFRDCTIIRTWVSQRSTLNMVTGEMKPVGEPETITGLCKVPIFSDEERATGICRSCRKGWEVDGNKFANEAERARAMMPAGALLDASTDPYASRKA